ncbi:hypothetical protein F4810DRAFT_691646 [Camillea tinctor]|nr:hypothetical protein F4810DRAFT_691646 [Camillea tinctor]
MSSYIHRLPESTTQLLGSHGVITNPVSVVKELLDNSIDAKATSVEVIISPDTVSRIEVRDNGVGIHHEDYDALGRRSHTSKIRNLHQLKMNTNTTLGFRGEALASTNCMATITITTKTSTDPVATLLRILPNTGGIGEQQLVSAPVGTTVTVTNLFGGLPVREQVAIKESKKTFEAVLELLRAYVMARPQLKLSFKVPQAPKYNWSYSPKQDTTIKEAIIQLFGVDTATRCFQKIVEVPASDDGKDHLAPKRATPPGLCYTFQAFIARPDTKPQHTSKHAYFSVDGRPLSSRGVTIRKLLNVYSEYLRGTCQLSSSNARPNFFIRLNIICPAGSYDVNIEPSKDDVLFSDENLIITSFRNLCEEVYKPISVIQYDALCEPEPNCPLPDKITAYACLEQARGTSAEAGLLNRTSDVSVTKNKQGNESEDSSSLLQEKKLSHKGQYPNIKVQDTQLLTSPRTTDMPTQPEPNIVEIPDIYAKSKIAKRPGFKVDMSSDYSEHINRSASRQKQNQLAHKMSIPAEISGEAEESPLQDLNPWIISKMNAPRKHMQTNKTTTRAQDTSYTPIIEPSITPDPPILRHSRAPPTDLDFPQNKQVLRSRDDKVQQRLIVPGGPYRSPISSPIENKFQGAPVISPRPHVLPQPRHQFAPWSPPSSITENIHSRNVVANSNRKDTHDGMRQTQISIGNAGATRGRKRMRLNIETDLSCLTKPVEGQYEQNDLQNMLTSARRNLDYQLSRPEEKSSTPQSRVPRSGNRNEEAKRSQPFMQLRTNACNGEQRAPRDKEPVATTLPDGDPRTYLLRRQRSRSANPRKLRRVKSSLMPLESVPPEDQTHALV